MTRTVAIINYGGGNLHSVEKAFRFIRNQEGKDYALILTNKPEEILSASHLVLPGQGTYGDCMRGLREEEGVLDALNEAVLQRGKAFIGICVGMQLLSEKGYEHGEHDGLGWIPGAVKRMTPNDPSLKVPHMGWNDTFFSKSGQDHPVLQGIMNKAEEKPVHFYFVHSFMMECKDNNHILASTQYGGDVPAIVGRDNIIGVQFHPEKSQDAGLSLLRNFIDWTP